MARGKFPSPSRMSAFTVPRKAASETAGQTPGVDGLRTRVLDNAGAFTGYPQAWRSPRRLAFRSGRIIPRRQAPFGAGSLSFHAACRNTALFAIHTRASFSAALITPCACLHSLNTLYFNAHTNIPGRWFPGPSFVVLVKTLQAKLAGGAFTQMWKAWTPRPTSKEYINYDKIRTLGQSRAVKGS